VDRRLDPTPNNRQAFATTPGVGEAAQGTLDFFEANAEPLGDLFRVWDASGRSGGYTYRWWTGLGCGPFPYAAADETEASMAFISSAVVRISCA
jgi:hypothetical protein